MVGGSNPPSPVYAIVFSCSIASLPSPLYWHNLFFNKKQKYPVSQQEANCENGYSLYDRNAWHHQPDLCCRLHNQYPPTSGTHDSAYTSGTGNVPPGQDTIAMLVNGTCSFNASVYQITASSSSSGNHRIDVYVTATNTGTSQSSCGGSAPLRLLMALHLVARGSLMEGTGQRQIPSCREARRHRGITSRSIPTRRTKHYVGEQRSGSILSPNLPGTSPRSVSQPRGR